MTTQDNITLIPFKHHGPWKIEAKMLRGGSQWVLDYKIIKTTETDQKINWPSQMDGNPLRRTGLWNETCFEAFFLFEDNTYEEWNFSPNGSWNCFGFESYRLPDPPKEKEVAVIPEIKEISKNNFQVTIPSRDLVKSFSLTTVLKVKKEEDLQTYFLAHTHAFDKADFHNQKLFLPLNKITL